MTKRNKIIYWIATIWLGLGMLSTGAVRRLFLCHVRSDIFAYCIGFRE
jgi:hypothetical protein